MQIKCYIINKIIPLKSEKIGPFRIEGFTYESINTLFKEIFFRGIYMFESDRKDPVILDCGANIGAATLYFKWLYPDSKIYSFEPDKETYKKLSENISRNKLKNVFLYNKAIHNTNKQLIFYVDKETAGSLGMSLNKSDLLKKKIIVQSVRLSEFLNFRVDFMKMDIEGAEIEVISDLCSTKKINKINEMIIEYHHSRPKKRSELGAFLRDLDDLGWNYTVNAFCIPLNQRNISQDLLIYCYRRKQRLTR